MTDEMKRFVNEIMDKPDSRIAAMRSVTEKAPEKDSKGELWASYEVGKTLYLVVALGPVEEDVEKRIRIALGHDAEFASNG